jgi:hypothetical protein
MLKSSGFAWRQLLSCVLQHELHFRPLVVDPGVRIHLAAKEGGSEHCELALVHVDDIPCISADAKPVVDQLAATFELKLEGMGEPKWCLGASAGKHMLADGCIAWHMSADDCAKEATTTAKCLHAEGSKGRALEKQKTPLPSSHKPELDVAAELTAEAGSRCLQLIGALRWAIKLGRIDVLHEVSVPPQCNASPWVGHLEAVHHAFGCLLAHLKSKLVLDPASPKPETDESAF